MDDEDEYRIACTVGSQADIYEDILFQNLSVCINTYNLCDPSFSKKAFLKILQSLRKWHVKA